MQGGEKTAAPLPKPTWQTSVASAQPTAKPNQAAPVDNISWTASEFIAHTKSAGWYGVLAGAAIGVSGIIYLLTKDRMTAGMVLFVSILFGVMASRKPRELSYILDEQGIKIGEKFYDYNNFKSFSVIQEGAVESIWFMPLQRFMPGLSIYFAPDQGDKIVDVLSDFLPFEPREVDPVDKLMHRLRF